MANSAGLIDRIAKDPDLSTEEKMHLLRQVDPDFPTEATVRAPTSALSTERAAPSPEGQAAQQESVPRAVLRGGLRGLEYLLAPGLAASEFLLDKMGVLPPPQPGERPESEQVIGALSDYLTPPHTAIGRVVERAGEEVGAGGPFLSAARRGLPLRLLRDYLASGSGAGVARELTPSFAKDLPGGQLASEVLGQLGGLGLARGASAGVRGLAHAIPSLRENKAHSAFLERLQTQIGSVDEAQRNIRQAVDLQRNLPGFRPSLGQASNDPGLLALEDQARRGSPQFEATMRQQMGESREALQAKIHAIQPEILTPIERVGESIQHQRQSFDDKANRLVIGAQDKLREIEARYTEQVRSLDPVTREQAGARIIEEVTAAKQAWQQEVNALYRTGPAASARNKLVSIDTLLRDLKALEADFDPAELPKSFPSDLVAHIRSLGTRTRGGPPTSQRLLEGPDASASYHIPLKSLTALRGVVAQAEAAERSALAPDRQLLRRLKAIQVSVEKQFTEALGSGVFSDTEVKALATATQRYHQGIEIFGADPITKLFRGGVHGEDPRLKPSMVAGMFFHSGKGGVEDAQALLAAVGPERGTALLRQDALAQITDLRDTAGNLPPGRFETWYRQHREVLHEHPSLRKEFGSLVKAQQAITTATKAVQQLPGAIKTPADLELDAAKLYLGKPTRLAISDMIDKPNSRELLRETLHLTRHDPMAQQGLRRGVWEELTRRMGITVPKDALWSEHSATVAEIIGKHKETLSTLYTPAQLKQLEQVAQGEAILQRMPKEQRVQLDDAIQKSGVADVIGKFWSRIFAVQRHAVGETFVLSEVASRRIINALEGLDTAKQRAILEHTLLAPDLMATFTKLASGAMTPAVANKKFHHVVATLGLESRVPPARD